MITDAERASLYRIRLEQYDKRQAVYAEFEREFSNGLRTDRDLERDELRDARAEGLLTRSEYDLSGAGDRIRAAVLSRHLEGLTPRPRPRTLWGWITRLLCG